MFKRADRLRPAYRELPGKRSAARKAMRAWRPGFVLVDLPGTYSLCAHSQEEEITRDFILSGEADVTVIVCDATCLERNLNLALQTRAVTERAVLCLNLMDEAEKKQIRIDVAGLAKRLGMPVVATSARSGKGLLELMDAVQRTARLPHMQAGSLQCSHPARHTEELVREAEAACRACVTHDDPAADLRRFRVDRLLTGRFTGIPVMLLMLRWSFSSRWRRKLPFRASFQMAVALQDQLSLLFQQLGAPSWLHDAFVLGMYRVLAWAFPSCCRPWRSSSRSSPCSKTLATFPACVQFGSQLQTLPCLRQTGADHVHGLWLQCGRRDRLPHHRQPTRAPHRDAHEQFCALQRAFPYHHCDHRDVLCGGKRRGGAHAALLRAADRRDRAGRYTHVPFFPPAFGDRAFRHPFLFHAGAAALSHAAGRKVLLRSVLDRTLFVLGRAVAVAAPAGLILWLFANLNVGGMSILARCTAFLDPFARLFGLDGVLLMAFILGIPANEIVLPIALMGYMAAGSLADLPALDEMRALLIRNGWTWLTAVCTVLFSLLHWPCSTTLITIKKETGSLKWTALAFLLPTAAGLLICFLVATLARASGLHKGMQKQASLRWGKPAFYCRLRYVVFVLHL